MPSAELRQRVRRAARLAALCVLVAASSCAEGFTSLSQPSTPQALQVGALRPGVVRVSWERVDAADVNSYVVERRANLAGEFEEVALVPQNSLERILFIDTDVDSDTYYGYRVRTLSGVGDRSAPSVVGGVRTPPPPGIEIGTATTGPSAAAIDPDGYVIAIIGADSLTASLGVNATRRFAPLRAGEYRVALRGLASRCSVNGDTARVVAVTDTSAQTTANVNFQVSCSDPNRGELAVTVTVSGDSLDPEFFVDVLGQAADATLPDAERLYSSRRSLPLAAPRARFEDLRPGRYEVTLGDVAGNCDVAGETVRSIDVVAAATATIGFNVVCEGPTPPVSTAPYVWRNQWSAASAPKGSTVALDLSLDLTANANTRLLGVQADVRYDPAVLRFDEETIRQLPVYTINATVPGVISFIASTTPTALRSGNVQLIRFGFTVVGDSGASTTTRTENLKASDRTAAGPLPIQDSVRVEEGTFRVGAGGTGTGGNTPPLAVINGPYSGQVGTPIGFSSVGSNDPGGSIAAYLWTFGDNSTSTQANPTKTYATAGVFPVTLDITDNGGLTTRATTTATVVPPTTGGNQPPVARANGPYSASVGQAVSLSAAGSLDADGSIVVYQWLLGDGRTVTGATPSVTYATAGTYNVTLTVTDNNGATASASSTVVVAPAAGTLPLVWRNVFGPVDVATRTVAITVSYDLRTNIAETPSAEALQSFVVDSIKWNPTLLQFQSINLGPNIVGTSNQAGVNNGQLGFRGTISGAQQQGLITIATLRFRIQGPLGAVVNTSTHLGPLIGASSTGFYPYNSKTSVVEGQLVLP